MSTHRIDKFTGLHTSTNGLSQTPNGALRRATNVCIRTPGTITPRTGFEALTPTRPALSSSATELAYYGTSYVFAATSTLQKWSLTGLGLIGTVQYRGISPSTSTTGNAPVTAPTSRMRMKFCEAKGSLYYAENSRVWVLDADTGTAQPAGVPGAVGSYAMTASTAGTVGKFLANGSSVAYRFVWGFKDASGNLKLGAPSGREVFVNSTGSACNVSIQVIAPPDLTTSHFLRIYRTESVATGVPSEDYFLVYEQTGLTATDLDTNKRTPAVVDIAPDAWLATGNATSLYTNSDSAGGDGSLAANNRPPRCLDLTYFADRMLYANTTQPHALLLTLLGVNPTGATGSSGLANTNTVVIGGVTYTATTGAENIATRTFKLANTGSTERDIRDTCLSFARVVNGNTATDGFQVGYLSSDDDMQGQMVVYRNTYSQSSFSVTTSANGAAWSPALPTSGTTVTSAQEASKNRIYYSKVSQPDAVPALNFTEVGVPSKNIWRIVPLKDTLFVFKDDGLFALRPTGSDTVPFQVDPVDASFNLQFPDSVVELGQKLRCLEARGFVELSPSGEARRFGDEIQDWITGTAGHDVFSYADTANNEYVTVGFENFNDPTDLSVALVYNVTTQAWTSMSDPFSSNGLQSITCGRESPLVNDGGITARRIILAADTLYQQRRNDSGADAFLMGYDIDPDDVNVTAIAASGVNWTIVGTVAVNDVLVLGTIVAQVTASLGAGVYSMRYVAGPALSTATTGFADVCRPFTSSVRTAYSDLGAQGFLKHACAYTLHFRHGFVTNVATAVTTDITTTEAAGTFALNRNPGTSATSSLGYAPPVNKRVVMPSGYERLGYVSIGFDITEGVYSLWAMDGIAVEHEVTSERNST